MSVVTDTILLYGLGGRDDDDFGASMIPKINAFFGASRGFVHVDEVDKGNWYGGHKRIQANVAIGAFNYLDLDGLRAHLRSLDWAAEDVRWVQLCYSLEEDEGFTLEAIWREP